MILEILKYYAFFASFCTVSILIGALPARLIFRIKWFDLLSKNLFASFLFGQMTVCLVYALIRSSFHSIFLVAVPLLPFLYYAWFRPKNQNLHSNSDSCFKYQGFILFFFSIIAFAWEALFFFNAQNLTEIPFKDINFYARTAEGLRITGIENIKAPFFIIDEQVSNYGIHLYHFYEHWLSALLIDSYGISPTMAYLLIVMPSLYLLTFYGAYILSYFFIKKNNFLYGIFCAVGLFYVRGIHFDFYEQSKLLEYSRYLIYAAIIWKKTIIYYPMFLLCVFFVVKDQIKIGFYVLLLLGVFYISALPAVYIAVFFTLIVLVICKKISNRDVFEIVLFYSLFMLIFLTTYFIFKDEIYLSPESALRTLLQFDFKVIKTRVFLFIGTLLKIFILYLPYVLGLVMYFQKSFLDFTSGSRLVSISLFSSLIVSAMLLWTVLYEIHEAWQLFLNTGIPACTFLLLSLTLISPKPFAHSSSKIIKYLGVTLIAGCILYNFSDSLMQQKFFIQANRQNFSVAYLKEIKQFLDTQDSEKLILGVSITAPNEYPEKAAPHMMQRGNYMYGMRNRVFTYQMDDFEEAQKRNGFRKRDLTYLPFYQFVEQQKKAQKFKTIRSSQVAFFQKHSFRYLIVSPNVEIPEQLLKSSSKVIKDTKSGERFLIYNYQK